MIFTLDARPVFPPPASSEPDGLLAVGGDLREARLLEAYRCGIFPWYSSGGRSSGGRRRSGRCSCPATNACPPGPSGNCAAPLRDPRGHGLCGGGAELRDGPPEQRSGHLDHG